MTKSLDVQASFCDSQSWNPKYTRTRHRNVRCFPTCARPFHKARSFCGETISLNLNVPVADPAGIPIADERVKQFHVYCCFRSTSHPLWLSIGDVCKAKTITSCEEDFVCAHFVSFDPETRRAVFEVRPPRKWQYNVQRDTPTSLYSKSFDSDEHCFAAFVVDAVTSACVGQCDSPGFHIVSVWKRETPANRVVEDTEQQNNNNVRVQKRGIEATARIAKRRAVQGGDGRWPQMFSTNQQYQQYQHHQRQQQQLQQQRQHHQQQQQQQQQQASFLSGGTALSNPMLGAYSPYAYRELLASVAPNMGMYPAQNQLGFSGMSSSPLPAPPMLPAPPPPMLQTATRGNTLPPNYMSSIVPFSLPAQQQSAPLLNKALLPFTSSSLSAMTSSPGEVSFPQPNSATSSRRGSVTSNYSSAGQLFATPSSSPTLRPGSSAVLGKDNHLNLSDYRGGDNTNTASTTPSVSPRIERRIHRPYSSLPTTSSMAVAGYGNGPAPNALQVAVNNMAAKAKLEAAKRANGNLVASLQNGGKLAGGIPIPKWH